MIISKNRESSNASLSKSSESRGAKFLSSQHNQYKVSFDINKIPSKVWVKQDQNKAHFQGSKTPLNQQNIKFAPVLGKSNNIQCNLTNKLKGW